MKKLNRKGFTLVELLAVIIILAIVVGITIPAITNIINDSKNNAMGVVVDAAEDYLADQYGYMNVDYNTASSDFKNVVTGPVTSAKTLTFDAEAEDSNDEKLLKAMGFSKENVTSVSFTISATGVACVKVVSVPTSSEYYSTKYFTASGNTATPNISGDVADYQSRSCS